jgi:hypothetical protein
MRVKGFSLVFFSLLAVIPLAAGGRPEVHPGQAPGIAVSSEPGLTGIKGHARQGDLQAFFFGDGSLRVYRNTGGGLRQTGLIRFYPAALDFSRSGDLAIGSGGKILLTLKQKDSTVSLVLLYDDGAVRVAAVFSGGSLRLPSFYQGGVLAASENRVVLFGESGTADKEWVLPRFVSALAPLPDGSGWIAGDTGGGLYRSEGDGYTVLSLRHHTSPVIGVIFSPGGDSFASVSIDGSPVLWDAAREIPLPAPGDGLSGGRVPERESGFGPVPLAAELTDDGFLLIGEGDPDTGVVAGWRTFPEVGRNCGITGMMDGNGLTDPGGALVLQREDGVQLRFFPGRGNGWALMDPDGLYSAGNPAALPFVRLVPAADPSGQGLPLAEEVPVRVYAGRWLLRPGMMKARKTPSSDAAVPVR